MSDSPNTPPIKRFCDLWAGGFTQMMASLGVASPTVTFSEAVSAPAPSAEEFEKLVCLRFTGGGAIKGELLWVAEKRAALQFAQLVLSGPPTPDAPYGDEQRDAFAEFLRQVAVQTAAAWKAEFGNEIELSYQDSAGPAPVTTLMINLRLTGEEFVEASLRLFLEPDLCTSISSAQPPPSTRVEPAEVQAEVEEPPSPRSTPLPANLGLVLDVELEATIRFGERQMLLRDIFGLIAGAVVELDQMVSEPAELLVAGRLVARGEVVVVDGNFGLRVTEVVSVNERVAAIPL